MQHKSVAVSVRTVCGLVFACATAVLPRNLLHAQAATAQAGREGVPPAVQTGRGRGPFVPSGPGRSNNPFPDPIPATDGVITVNFVEFATVPDAGTDPPRMNLLLDEPATHRMFVNTMQGMLYSVSYDGKTVKPYLDLNDPQLGQSGAVAGTERGFQSFAFHPQFAQAGTPGYGKFYTYADTTNMTPKADFVPLGAGHTHDEMLLEWTAKNPKADAYDGGAPRELFRVAHPFANHNGGRNRLQPAGQARHAATSGCSTSAPPTAAAAAIRTTTRRT